MTTRYEPTAEDRAAYGRLMLVFPELRQECIGSWANYGIDTVLNCADCSGENDCPGGCHGTGYVAPQPETWCGLLVRVAAIKGAAINVGFGGAVVWEASGPGVPFEAACLESALLDALEQAAAAP